MPHSTQASLNTLSSLSDAEYTYSRLPAGVSATAQRGNLAQRHSSTVGLSPVSSVESSPTRADSRSTADTSALSVATALSSQGRDTAIHTMPERNTVNYSAEAEAGKRRLQYYEDVFAYKENGTTTARDRVHREAPVVAELRTNVIVCTGTC